MNEPVLEKLSYYALNYEPNKDTVLEAKFCFFDSLACALLSLRQDNVQKFLKLPYLSKGEYKVIGTNIKTNIIDSVFLNGALIRWLDFNDTWLAKEWGHPSDNLGAVLSLVDFAKNSRNLKISFKNLLENMVIAHEIQGSLAIENSLNEVGLDHVAFVKVASAAVTSRILGHTKQQMLSTLSNAFVDGQSLRTYRHYPNTGARKSWAAGDASARGVKHAFISEISEETYPSALSAERWGFNDVLMHKSPLVLERELNSYVMDNILYKVLYPAEFHAQTAAESAIKIHQQIKGRIADIKKIQIFTQEPGVRIISKQGELKNYADRDHCIEYIVASCLINGTLDSNSYLDEVANNPLIDNFRSITRTNENEEYTKLYYDLSKRAIPNKVIVEMKNGDTYSEEILYPLGHKKRRKEALPHLNNKFLNAINNSDLDAKNLLSLYNNDLEKIDIDEVLTNIFK